MVSHQDAYTFLDSIKTEKTEKLLPISVLHFQPDLSLVKLEDSARGKELTRVVQGTDHFSSTFKSGLSESSYKITGSDRGICVNRDWFWRRSAMKEWHQFVILVLNEPRRFLPTKLSALGQKRDQLPNSLYFEALKL